MKMYILEGVNSDVIKKVLQPCGRLINDSGNYQFDSHMVAVAGDRLVTAYKPAVVRILQESLNQRSGKLEVRIKR
jgi:hypothetical protein